MPRKDEKNRIIDRVPERSQGIGLTLQRVASAGSGTPEISGTYLWADGSIALRGNLPVVDGITIDGVDLSVLNAAYQAHVGNPHAHHTAFTSLTSDTGIVMPDGSYSIAVLGGNGLRTNGSSGTVSIHMDTPTTIGATTNNQASSGHTHQIDHSSSPGSSQKIVSTNVHGGVNIAADLLNADGLNRRVGIGMTPSGARLDVTGSGSEAAFRVQGANTTTALVELIANNLTSGSLLKATLPSDRPILEARGNGDTQPRLQLLPTGVLIGSGSATPDVGLRRGSAQSLIVDDNGLGGAVDLNVSRKITAGSTTPGAALLNSIWSGGAQLRLGYDATNYMDFLIDNGGSLTMNPTGDLILDPGGNDVRPLNNYDVNLGLINKKWLSLHAAELVVETLVAQSTIATIGGRILVGPTTTLTSDLPASGSGTTTPPTFVAASALATADTSTSVSQTPPAGTSSGMLMLAHVTSRGNAQTFTTPSGWTLVPNTTVRDTSTTPDNDSVVFYKLAGANETTPYTFTASVSGTLGVVISVWSGVDPTSPINASASQSNASSNSITAPSITTTVANTRLVMLVGGATTKLITPPASMTEVWETSGGGSTVNSWGSHEAYTSTGSTGTRIAIYTDGSLRTSVGILIALTPTPASGGTSITVKHNQLINGDTVYMEANGKVEFMRITSAASGTGPYTYSVTRDLDGTGANDWYAGDALFNTGQATNGFIDLYSLRGVKSASQAGPTIVGNVRNSQTFNDWSEHWAIGNLNGLYDYASNVYGFAAGKYTGASGTTPWISVDATNGFRVMRGSTKLGQWDTGGDITVGQVASGKGNVLIDSGGVRLRTNTVVKLDAQTDGDLLLGTNTTAPSTTFLSLFSVAQTYNGEAMASGEILLGDNSTGRVNLKWTSANELQLRRGITPQITLSPAGGGTITGMTVQTGATGTRTVMAPDGFKMYLGTNYLQVPDRAYVRTFDENNGSVLFNKVYAASDLGSVTRLYSYNVETIGHDTTTHLRTTIQQYNNATGRGCSFMMNADRLAGTSDTYVVLSANINASTRADMYLMPSGITFQSTHGGVKVGTPGWIPVWNPSAGSMIVQNTLIAGNIYPGSQTTRYFSVFQNPWGYPDTALYGYGSLAIEGTILCSNYFRSVGATGWYNQSYGGGLWQQTAGYIETYYCGLKTGYVGVNVAPESNKAVVINGQNDATDFHGLVVRNASGLNRMYVGNNGSQNWVSSAWQVGSDRSLKDNIKVLGNEDTHGGDIDIVSYVRKSGGSRREVGVIAQDVRKAMPEAVIESENGTLAVVYSDVELYMIHHLRLEVNKLWKEIASLKSAHAS